VPAVPSCLLMPIWVEFCALTGGEKPPFHPAHPLSCHRRRVPDRVVFEHVVAALVHGSGYERIATTGCSDHTIRRRLKPVRDCERWAPRQSLRAVSHDRENDPDLRKLCRAGQVLSSGV